MFRLFFFNDTATTEIYTLSLHDALPILAIAPLVLLRLIAGLWVIDTVSLAVPVTVTPSGLVPWSVAVLVIEPASMSACVRVAVPEVGRAHVCTPVTLDSRMPSSALKKKFAPTQ